MTTMTTKRARPIRYPGTRLALVTGSVVAFLGMWLQIARTGEPSVVDAQANKEAALTTGVAAAVAESTMPAATVVAQPAVQDAPAPVHPTPVPRAAISRGS